MFSALCCVRAAYLRTPAGRCVDLENFADGSEQYVRKAEPECVLLLLLAASRDVDLLDEDESIWEALAARFIAFFLEVRSKKYGVE